MKMLIMDSLSNTSVHYNTHHDGANRLKELITVTTPTSNYWLNRRCCPERGFYRTLEGTTQIYQNIIQRSLIAVHHLMMHTQNQHIIRHLINHQVQVHQMMKYFIFSSLHQHGGILGDLRGFCIR